MDVGLLSLRRCNRCLGSRQGFLMWIGGSVVQISHTGLFGKNKFEEQLWGGIATWSSFVTSGTSLFTLSLPCWTTNSFKVLLSSSCDCYRYVVFYQSGSKHPANAGSGADNEDFVVVERHGLGSDNLYFVRIGTEQYDTNEQFGCLIKYWSLTYSLTMFLYASCRLAGRLGTKHISWLCHCSPRLFHVQGLQCNPDE